MPKRNLAPHDSEDEHISTNSQKRARTSDSDDDDEPPPTQKRNKGRRARDDSDDDEDDDGEKPDAEAAANEDEEFERLFGDKLRAHLESKRGVTGGVAEYGIIEYVEMHQFMCHKFLKFNFGPQINFIIGHNGSGKSAVLSAITVALGGKTNSTGRGSGLKSFIREGQGKAEVSIHIKNQGDEAYKPHEYGKTIVITRAFTREGSSSWKIAGKDSKKMVSNKKEELAAICDHMNIQVDNPMNVLTQDAARQFLSASAPQDKYQFFLRGTQLAQLSDEYQVIMNNTNQTAKVIAVKKEAIPDLKVRLREVSVRYEEASKAREQKKKVDELKKELAWAHVAAKEAEMTAKLEEAAKLAKRLPQIENKLEEAKAAFDAASEMVGVYEAEFRAIGEASDLEKKKKNLQAQMKNKKDEIQRLGRDLSEIRRSIQMIDDQISQLDTQIKAEADRMATHTQAKHEENQRNLDEAKAQIASAEHRIGEVISKRKQLSVEADHIKSSGEEVERQQKAKQAEILHCESMIRNAQERERDSYLPYGRNIKGVLAKFQQTRWFGDVPLGPLGLHVKAKDPQTWGELLRNQLMGLLLAFAITDPRDRNQLKKILVESGNQHATIVVYEKDLFDYSRGEPPSHLLTVLRALDISDPYVLRIFINQAHIESQILAPTRKEAEATLRTIRGGGSAWALDNMAVRVYHEGGVYSSKLHTSTRNDASNLLLTGRDTASDMRHFSELKAQHEAEHHQLLEQVNSMKREFHTLKNQMEKLNKEEESQNRELRRWRATHANLIQAANEELPAALAGFEGAKDEALLEKANLEPQAEVIAQQQYTIGQEGKELQGELNAIKAQLNALDELRRDKNKLIEQAVEDRLSSQKDMKYYQQKHDDEKSKVDTVDEQARVLQEEFTKWTETAQDFCERVPNPRKAADVQRNLESVQKALKARENEHGATVEEMAVEVNKAKENLVRADKEIKGMTQLNKTLKASLILRFARWQDFRRHIALRCKHVFQYHLSQRGYYGKIIFNHTAGTLQLRVQTDDQLQTQGTKDKDPRSLSGGEKSFSTICLLLSLWESIGCPLRCLDEFDVFMDAVNRRISMKMMIDTANTSDKKQYILITPQDMTNVSFGPTVKVHRMPDPDRNAGTLPFTSS